MRLSAPPKVVTLVQYWRLGHLALHLLLGGTATLLAFPLLPPGCRARLRQLWSRRLLATLGIRLEGNVEGPPRGSLIVANHVSWVDIFAINALAPAAFISKAEVRNWPLVGWLAARNDTVFLRRGSAGHARVINAEIAELMAAGNCVAVFPEGTTTDGSHILHFHSALLQPAIAAGRPIVPVAIRYEDARGAPSTVAAYAGETSLWQCIRAIAGARGLTLRLSPCTPLTGAAADRKQLARQARSVIADALFDRQGHRLRHAA
ncbi:Putative phospholipid/glycerol acyltransferase [Aromatoleum bremense]|uniref:1-acyl-sn-glycerol-3-phosphate acyltransferase n=1 Tax=Aromatoleum bremense TaxID=76115 RepID=A0ABX1NSZ3_9RHOO|nr:1-acyl-sn-glycerol-3-phosphate acyltransferase [Aromatoleum bremense]QTQ31500.1 Putative phospholipid/glycerol acyltransferase [Aromatoleum bremense]